MGLMLAEPGFHTRCWVEWEEYPRSVIVAGQRAGYFAPAPIWDDLTTFDARPFAGCIDTLLAGYPCQPFSHAGQRKGTDDERHLWPDVARVARELGPSLEWLFLENVAGHLTLGLEAVLREIRDMDFTPAVGLFTAAETGAPHERERVFIVAHRQSIGAGEQNDEIGPFARGDARRCLGRSRRGLHGELGDTNCGDDARGLDCGTIDREAGGSQASDEGPGHPSYGKRVWPQSSLASDDLEHAAGLGRGEGRAEPEVRGGRDTASGADSTLADAARVDREIHAGSRGEGRGTSDSGRPVLDMANAERNAGYQGGCGRGRDKSAQGTWEADCAGAQRPFLHPPGPADMGRWADVLVTSPDLAPSASFGDLASFAGQVAAMAQAGLVAEAEIEPALRRMADGLALRSRALRLLGNGVHPLAAGHAWRTLSAAHGLRPLDLGAAGKAIANRTTVIHMSEAAHG